MLEKKTIMIKNGDMTIPYNIYYCARCGMEIEESHPAEEFDGEIYCGDCAFILGLITENQLLDKYYFFYRLSGRRAIIHDGEVFVGTGKFPWERTSRDRECKEYKEWRISVFSRDGFTCQLCGQVGGKLNAHHIKPYKKYPKLRYALKNGMTLCEECHRNIHRKHRK